MISLEVRVAVLPKVVVSLLVGVVDPVRLFLALLFAVAPMVVVAVTVPVPVVLRITCSWLLRVGTVDVPVLLAQVLGTTASWVVTVAEVSVVAAAVTLVVSVSWFAAVAP